MCTRVTALNVHACHCSGCALVSLRQHVHVSLLFICTCGTALLRAPPDVVGASLPSDDHALRIVHQTLPGAARGAKGVCRESVRVGVQPQNWEVEAVAAAAACRAGVSGCSRRQLSRRVHSNDGRIAILVATGATTAAEQRHAGRCQ
jgi:hypothetical protein